MGGWGYNFISQVCLMSQSWDNVARLVCMITRTRHCNGDVLALSNLPPGYDEEQTSSLASLEARWPWPAEQASRTRAVRSGENASLWLATLVCAHGTAILTNRGPSELVEERIFYAIQVRTRTI